MSPIGKLDGMVAVITGAGGGIGAASARLFAAEGARVALVDVRPDEAEPVAAEIRRTGGEALATGADIADERQVADALAKVDEAWGAVDVLVNNAGIALNRRLLDTTVEEWDRVLAVNLRGAFLAIKHGAPLMRGAGAIVNIASVAALMAVRGTGAYTAAKGGLLSLTRVAAAELGPGIRVNCICPGTVLTAMPDEMLRRRGGGDHAAGVRATAEKYLLGRLGEPTDIARAALFLAGPDSSFFTGAVVAADGGVTAQ